MTTQVKTIDPRVKRTRQLLQQAMMELVQEQSISSISIQDITERATVNRATFYAHFEDKFALMDSIIREQFQLVVISKLPAGYGWEKQSLRALILGVFDFLGEFRSHCSPTPSAANAQFEPQFERAIQQEIYNILLGWLKRAPRAGAGPRVSVETMASVMSWAIFGTAANWSRGEQKSSAQDMTNQVVQLLVDGLKGTNTEFV